MAEPFETSDAEGNKIVLYPHFATWPLGEVVFLKVDPQRRAWLIAGVVFDINGSIVYRLLCGTVEGYHSGREITKDRDWLLTEAGIIME